VGFPGGSGVKNPPAKKHETQVPSLGWDDTLEKEERLRKVRTEIMKGMRRLLG